MDAISQQVPGAALSRKVIGAFHATYNELGHGFLESVYENALAIELEAQGLECRQQVPIEVRFRNKVVGLFRADFIIQDRLILEVKAVQNLLPVHEVQILNYLKATGIRLGLLLNFGPRAQVKRRIL